MNFSRIFFKTTGLMPKKEIMRTCQNIGKELAEQCKSGEKVEIANVKDLLQKSIGSKSLNKILVSDDYDTFYRYAKKLGLKDELIFDYYNSSLSAVMPGINNDKTLLLLRLGKMDTSEAINVTSHELEHTLFNVLSPYSFKNKLSSKFFGKKNYIDSDNGMLNANCLYLQQYLLWKSKIGKKATCGYTSHDLSISGLLKQMNIKSVRELHSTIDGALRRILVNDSKTNIKILKVAKRILKDESRAYKTGGAVERYWIDLSGKSNQNANNSELYAMLYDETIARINKELRHQRINHFKSYFNLEKPLVKYTTDADGSTTVEFMGKKCKLVEEEVSEGDVPNDIWEELNKN